jgi:hypothetical protein
MRALKLALLIVALLPTVYLRVPKPAATPDSSVNNEDLLPGLLRQGSLPVGEALHVAGAWRLSGGGSALGTFSGLAQTRGGFVAVGDRGAVMWFTRPDRTGPWRSRLTRLINLEWRAHPHPVDAESVAVEPRTGALLVGYEDAPALIRFTADLTARTLITLPVLSAWPSNQGPEAMTRLADGRTVIIGEAYSRWFDRTMHAGLVFPDEPHPRETPVRFAVRMPPGFRPSELAQMPDGRLLVLGRGFSFAGFRTVIGVFAPSDLRPGATITPRTIARIEDPRIRENYEGMTVTAEPDGGAAIWLLSDSNQMVWAQRTLLLKLRLEP